MSGVRRKRFVIEGVANSFVEGDHGLLFIRNRRSSRMEHYYVIQSFPSMYLRPMQGVVVTQETDLRHIRHIVFSFVLTFSDPYRLKYDNFKASKLLYGI